MTNFTIYASELHKAYKAVAHFAPKKDIVPQLTFIHFDVFNDYLTVSATDRYRAAAVRVRTEHEVIPSDNGKFLIDPVELGAALKNIDAKANKTVTITVEESGQAKVYDHNSLQEVLVTTGDANDYPPVGRLMTAAINEVRDNKNPVEVFAYNPKYLIDLSKSQRAVATTLDAAVFHPVKTKMVVTIGEDFVALFTGIRVWEDQAEEALKHWGFAL